MDFSDLDIRICIVLKYLDLDIVACADHSDNRHADLSCVWQSKIFRYAVKIDSGT